MNCKERYYDLIGQISVYDDTAVSFAQPFNEMKKHLTPADYTLTGAPLIKLNIKRDTGKLKETSSVSVNGESYEVTVTFDVEQVDASLYEKLDLLKKGFNHLILNSFPDNKMMVRSTEYAYRFEYKENDGILQGEFTIQNMNGAQRVF